MKTIHNVKIDLLTPGLHPRVYAVQDDICTREVQISLYSGSVSWTPTSGAGVAVGYRKSDGTVGIYDTLPDGSSAVSISGNVVTVILAAQMLTAAGTVEAAVTLADANGNQISTFAFDVIVSANPGSGAVKSEDYFNYVNPRIQAAIESAEKATTAANAASDRANAASDRANAASVVAYQANEKVDTLREVVSKLHSNIVETASGEVIRLSDASDMELAGLRVFGKTQQRTTTGKNLLKITATDGFKINGITIYRNPDGSITLDGSSTTEHSRIIGTATLPAGNYRITGIPAAFSEVEFWIYENDTKITEVTSTKETFTLTKNTECAIRFYFPSTAKFNMTVFYPMLRLASITDATYEPYTGGAPAPNPEYPQALESVGDGGSVTVTVSGKNMFNKDGMDFMEPPGDTITILDTGFRITANASGSYRASFVSLGKIENYIGKVLTLQADLSATGAATPYVLLSARIRATYKTVKNFGTLNRSRRTITITVDDNAEYIGAELCIIAYSSYDSVAAVGDYSEYQNLQLEIGNKATDYESYKDTTAVTVTPVDTSGNALYLPGIRVGENHGGNYKDKDGQWWICDEVDFEKGVYIQKVRMVSVSKTTSTSNSLMILPDTAGAKRPLSIISNYADGAKFGLSDSVENIFIRGSANTSVNKVNLTYTELNALLAETPMVLVYALAEEKHIPLSEIDPDALAQYATLHTNYPNTTILNDARAEMEVKYVADTQKYVDKKFEALEAAIANLI